MVVPLAREGPTFSSTSIASTPTATTARSGQPNGVEAAAGRGKMASGGSNGNGHSQSTGNAVPLSFRRSLALDLSTVERRGQPTAAAEQPKAQRLHGLTEAPTFRPSEDEFRDPIEYIKKIAPDGKKYGIVKIIPPNGWNPDFAVDTERFHFRTRRQELNSMEGGTRTNLNYLDQLVKFHKQSGQTLSRFPSVDKRPLDLYKLKKAVETRGGFEKVCKGKKWAEIGRDLGYSGKIMSSLSTSLKNSYQRWLQPYEDYLRVAKPGVQQLLEQENGGPFTPSPGPSPAKKPIPSVSASLQKESPIAQASAALNASLQEDRGTQSPKPEPARPAASSGFTPVNAGGFTPVNAPSVSSGFAAVNTPNGSYRDKAGNQSSPPRHLNGSISSMKHISDSKHSVSPNASFRASNQLKRQHSVDGDQATNGDAEAAGRRSKRLKQDAPPTVAGSHMTQPRLPTPRLQPPRDHVNGRAGEKCESCGKEDELVTMLHCESCDCAYHRGCLEPPLKTIPDYDWHCPRCLVGTGDFGFEEGGIYSLKQFQEKANNFKENYFRGKIGSSNASDGKLSVSEDEIEREFWRLVESLTDTVEVEYGADIHTTTHGSGFPTIEKCPRDAYSTDPWNLNILPLHPESLFRHIKSDISGMTVPWLYVGMCFSTFCWHNEDHYTYSANYQHFGATKTWYGIPADDALKFENAMREAVPELFETQPDLLFQLVTLLPPERLQKAGVRVYALDQRAGQFVVTFPQAYHAGFNHGFNFNEAVNFAPQDWEPFGEAGVQRLQEFRRQPCFSHDELLLTAAARDTSIKTSRWLAPALERLYEREIAARSDFFVRRKETRTETREANNSNSRGVDLEVIIDENAGSEEDLLCSYCKTYSYLSRYICKSSGKSMCLLHAGVFPCCEGNEETRMAGTENEQHMLTYRMTDETLKSIVQRVVEKARIPEVWAEKVDKILEDDPKPSLKVLRSLLSEGERIPWDLPRLPGLRKFVERCNEWVEEATNYITRKQQNRRKNEKVWRKGSAAKVAEMEERDRELRKVDNIRKLLMTADAISFDCPEITELRKRAVAIAEFQQEAQKALSSFGVRTTQELEELVEVGKGFSVDIPEIERLDKVVQQVKWYEQARERRGRFQTLQDVSELVQQGVELGIPDTEKNMVFFREQKRHGELWEAKARELMSVENVHYQQLDALSKQAASLPVSSETLAAVDAILKKQRDAQEQILSLYERSKHPDFRQRPRYKEVREAMEALSELNSKPPGTIDLEKEQKRHEDWMRKGKKLFGKANAPLHILLSHMQSVEARNEACFDLRDQPRMPVEPSSREHTPVEDMQEVDASGSSRDVFCICRKPEAGMMIECELCHEWYHGKCLKIARGKVKEDDKYTCPICDYRVKIPRDAARPKLEDLQAWQDEIPTLPFQPEEEECLANIINHAQEFRQFMASYMNPMLSNPDELTTQRFYLRKIEGADILLTDETNFFKQELHKWAPVAPEPPPVTSVSLSTRKPRPTKQQKLMYALGINDPADLPENMRTKQHGGNRRKASEAHAKNPPSLQASTGSRPHTPSGLPSYHPSAGGSPDGDGSLPRMSDTSAGFGFNGMSITSSVEHDPLYVREDSFGEGHSLRPASPRNSTMDPALFSTSVYNRPEELDSPLAGAFPSNVAASGGSSSSQRGVMDSIFADLTNQDEPIGGGSSAGETLQSAEGGDADAGSQDFVAQFLHEDGEEKS